MIKAIINVRHDGKRFAVAFYRADDHKDPDVWQIYERGRRMVRPHESKMAWYTAVRLAIKQMS